MRQFKFRAWENGEMYYQVRCGGVFDGIPTAPTVWNEANGDWINLTGQPHTKIMQYTGLKDCNGKEIYEGDILADKRYTNLYDSVKYQDGQFVCIDYPDRNLFDNLNDLELEIIGNIYKNPELLN